MVILMLTSCSVYSTKDTGAVDGKINPQYSIEVLDSNGMIKVYSQKQDKFFIIHIDDLEELVGTLDSQ